MATAALQRQRKLTAQGQNASVRPQPLAGFHSRRIWPNAVKHAGISIYLPELRTKVSLPSQASGTRLALSAVPTACGCDSAGTRRTLERASVFGAANELRLAP